MDRPARRSGIRVWLLALLLAPMALASAAKLSEQMSELVRSAVLTGFSAQLPPHLSVMLGVSGDEVSVPVRQLTVRSAAGVRTLNVCAGNYEQIVLMNVTSEHQVQAYLMSQRGKLLRALSYEAGGHAHELTLKGAGENFIHERQFWLARLQSAASKP